VELMRGRAAEAIGAFERLRTLQGDSAATEVAFAQAEAVGGARDRAEERIDRLRARRGAGVYVPAFELAKAELALGRRERAAAELRRAFAERDHSLAFLLVDPAMSAMRDHPTVGSLAGKLGLSRAEG
jgi:hypothetical protein